MSDLNDLYNRQFTTQEQNTLLEVIFARRDVRGNQFLDTPVEQEKLETLLRAANAAPSVGLSQPWEFVLVTNAQTKQRIFEDSMAEKQKAENGFNEQQTQKYRDLKLEGILEAPVNIAVFCRPPQHKIIGNNSMPQTLEYSVVCAIQNMWLMARSLNIGMGWVSIINPETVCRELSVPRELNFVAWLCLGYCKEFHEIPEFEKTKWATRNDYLTTVSHNTFGNRCRSLDLTQNEGNHD